MCFVHRFPEALGLSEEEARKRGLAPDGAPPEMTLAELKEPSAAASDAEAATEAAPAPAPALAAPETS